MSHTPRRGHDARYQVIFLFLHIISRLQRWHDLPARECWRALRQPRIALPLLLIITVGGLAAFVSTRHVSFAGISQAFGQAAFDAHGNCFLWQTNLLWAFVLANGLIALAYYSIPASLIYFARKRTDLAFRWVFLIFGAFILACGTSHIMDIIVLWIPVYWYQATVNALTAIFSIGSALAVWWIIPDALKIPSNAQLATANADLRQLTRRLAAEVAQRRAAEAEVRRLNASLEALVQERTRQLEATNHDLRAEIVRRNEVEAALCDEQRRKDDFLAMASHELKTPVTGLKTFVQTLALRAKRNGDQALQGVLGRMESQINRLIRLVQDLLDISRLHTGQLHYESTTFDLDALVQECITQSAGQAPQHTVQVERHATAWMRGDRDRMSQVIMNLLNNAIKYSPPGTTVSVALDVQFDTAIVAVRDEGPGIDSAHHARIFEQFYQVQDAAGKTYPGLGIGLFLARQIVTHHGGHIDVASTPGAGACFIVTVPLRPSALPDREETDPFLATAQEMQRE